MWTFFHLVWKTQPVEKIIRAEMKHCQHVTYERLKVISQSRAQEDLRHKLSQVAQVELLRRIWFTCVAQKTNVYLK